MRKFVLKRKVVNRDGDVDYEPITFRSDEKVVVARSVGSGSVLLSSDEKGKTNMHIEVMEDQEMVLELFDESGRDEE